MRDARSAQTLRVEICRMAIVEPVPPRLGIERISALTPTGSEMNSAFLHAVPAIGQLMSTDYVSFEV